ncbi:hypothetical protein [Longimicrobium sp.]|jgi:hypothetical protein|uniref:hypothetical protein n=1 Tax=Longimicrobium sp. TaxID=2029185 RepID=UPI002ED9F7E2
MSQSTPAELTKAAQWMSNGDLALTAKAVFSTPHGNERNEAARMALVRELANRGIDPHTLGYDGGYVPLNPKPKKDPTLPAEVKAKKDANPGNLGEVQLKSGLDAEKLPDADLAALTEAGWKGVPGDDKEAVYPPADVLPINSSKLSDATKSQLIKAGWKLGGKGEFEQLTPPQDRLTAARDKLAKAAEKDTGPAGINEVQLRSQVDADDLPEADRQALLKAGWKGAPDDKKEALYPPADTAPLSTAGISDETKSKLIKSGWKISGQGTDETLVPPKDRVTAERDRVTKAVETEAKRAASAAEAEAKKQAAAAAAAQKAADKAAAAAAKSGATPAQTDASDAAMSEAQAAVTTARKAYDDAVTAIGDALSKGEINEQEAQDRRNALGRKP